MTDRELAGCALLPCNFPCEKCGSQDIARAFRPEGEKWRVEVYGRAESKYAYADAYVATSSRDHINHRCRCCQYEWQTLPMKKQRRNRRTPSSEGDGRDGEDARAWRQWCESVGAEQIVALNEKLGGALRLVRDAERYRWLRENAGEQIEVFQWLTREGSILRAIQLRMERRAMTPTDPNERARELLNTERDSVGPASHFAGSTQVVMVGAALRAIARALSHAAAVEGDWPPCPECKSGVLFECPACSATNYPPPAPAAVAGGECLHCGTKPDGALDGTLTLQGLIHYGRVAANPNQGAARWHLIDLVGQMLPHLEALAAQPAAGRGKDE